MTEQFRVVRLDFWDYRIPTNMVFDSSDDAIKKCAELQKLCDEAGDVLTIYLWEKVYQP